MPLIFNDDDEIACTMLMVGVSIEAHFHICKTKKGAQDKAEG